MKKQSIVLGALLVMTSGLWALTDAEAQKKGSELLQSMVNGHTRAFGQNAILKGTLDLSVWNTAIAQVKTFATTVINENKNFVGMKDSTLVSALEKITKAEMDLVNSIKITRNSLSSPKNLDQQITFLTKIKNDMIAVQKTLQSSSSSVAKKEAQKILNSTAMFIETTASKASREAGEARMQFPPSDLPPVYRE